MSVNAIAAMVSFVTTMKSLIEAFIQDYVKENKSQRRILTDWGIPLVAFADARNPLFNRLKMVVGLDHFLPSDLLNNARTVISYFVPFDKEIASSNNTTEGHASERWAIAYLETNQMILDLNESISSMFQQHGYRSTATVPTYDFDKNRLMSSWSHKHITFISGLGKFGIHNMIITEKGCCGRLGSIVTNVEIEPSRMRIGESCLYKINRSCGLCVSKCTWGALRIDDFDKHRCYEQCIANASVYSRMGLADVCGKCTIAVPCSFSDPSATGRTKE
ncbi:epoxyqueuosine reductase [Candidatus Bathyarchaeota archaeon]|nr:epoxyqueuosine reductase [Candidatus Bathyarchaeota archaeon]